MTVLEHFCWAAMIPAVTALLCGCGGNGPGPNPDAGPEAGREASVLDVSVPDVRDVGVTAADARPDTAWCGDNPFPGVDPNAQELISELPLSMRGFSWDASYITYARSTQPNADLDIYCFDLDLWLETRITNLPGSVQAFPTIHEGIIVWLDMRFVIPGVEDARVELMEYDITTGLETRLTDSPDSKTWPQVHGDHIVYSFFAVGSSSGELHLLERSSGDVTLLSPADRAAEGESIGSRLVAWVALPPNTPWWNKDVHIYDIQSGQTLYLESTANGLTYNTSVSGGKVVWQDDRNGQWDIYMYDVDTGLETRLTDDPLDQVAPQIHGNLVSFVDYRYTAGFDDPSCANDITILDIDTMISRRVTTLPWFWLSRPGPNGLLLAMLSEFYGINSPAKLYLFDLIDMGILDPTGQHVLPGP